MASFSVPLSVIVVAHDVNVVQVLVHLRDVVGNIDGGGSSSDCGSQDVFVFV